jgi:virginiamycin B lyase
MITRQKQCAGVVAAGLLVSIAGCGGGGGGSSAVTYTPVFREFAVPVAGNDPTANPVGSWPDDLRTDAAGNIWFPEHHANEVGKMTPAGVYTGYPVPTASGLLDGIVVDKTRGVVWASETAANKLARIDITSGAVTELTLPTANSVPGDLTTAPDGTIWFTEGYEGGTAKGKIAHLNPDTNAVTEFTPPNIPSLCDGIAVAPSGAVWFVENDDNNIACYYQGQFLTFPLPRAGVNPTNVAIDSQGRIWVTEQYGNAIAVYNVNAKTWKEYPIPNLSGQPSGIAIDTHDNVWFTEFGPGKIGVLPAGSSTIVDFLIPTPRCGPEDITIAADGSVYFTEQYGNKIGQISVSGLTAR